MANSTAPKANSSGRKSSRGSKNNQEINLSNTATVEPPASQEGTNHNTDKGAQVIPMPQLKLAETATEETQAISLPLPGNRPVASSDLKLSDVVSVMNNRPVDASNIQVLGTISAMGERPVVASNIEVLDTISVSGERPIARSPLQINEAEMFMGNRPIASNYIDGEEDLMGYLD